MIILGKKFRVIHLDQFATSGLFDEPTLPIWKEIKELLAECVSRGKVVCPIPTEHFLESSKKSNSLRNNLHSEFSILSSGFSFKNELLLTSQIIMSLIRKNNLTINTFLQKGVFEKEPRNDQWDKVSETSSQFQTIISENTKLPNFVKTSGGSKGIDSKLRKTFIQTFEHLHVSSFIAGLEKLYKNKYIKVGGTYFRGQPIPNWIDQVIYRLVTVHKIKDKEIQKLIAYFNRHGFKDISTLKVRSSLTALIRIEQRQENSSDHIDLLRIASGLQVSDVLLTDKRRKSEILEIGLDEKYNTLVLSGTPADLEELKGYLQSVVSD
ncbi:hypothetical protein [Ekhidna sp.]|uniref:hypothetical protein n=1 Tax=Ekhidna sp. TaxID=2608089 RepID=UPI003CCBF8DE